MYTLKRTVNDRGERESKTEGKKDRESVLKFRNYSFSIQRVSEI